MPHPQSGARGSPRNNAILWSEAIDQAYIRYNNEVEYMLDRVLFMILGVIVCYIIDKIVVRIYRRFRPAKPSETSDISAKFKVFDRYNVFFYLGFLLIFALAFIVSHWYPGDIERFKDIFTVLIIFGFLHMAMCLFFGMKLILLGAKANKQAALAPGWRNCFTAAGISLLMILIALIIKLHLGI
jgi:hypothetical protein